MAGKISIIIPVFNTVKYFKRCIELIINQTYGNLEIILIDDGSTDGSSELCDQYAAKDSRIICVHQENKGVSAARNRGIELCTGSFIHFPDSDDYLDLDTYRILMDVIEQQECDCVVFEYYIEFPNKAYAHVLSDDQYGAFTGIQSQKKLFNGFHFVCTKFFKNSVIGNLRFREDIRRGEDTLFAAMAMKNCEKIWFIKQPLYHYIQSDDSACRGRFRVNQLTIYKLYPAYKELYRDFEDDQYETVIRYLHDNLIMIYYDMWSDENSYDIEQKELCKQLRKFYLIAIKGSKRNLMKILKFSLASFTPAIYCHIHKLIHNL